MAAETVKSSGKLDVFFLMLILCLTAIGIFMVFDSSYPYALAHHLSVTKFLELQAMWGVAGVGLLLFASRYGYWKLRKYAAAAMWICIALLALTLIPHIGIIENGSRRWLGHGSFRMQPSELAKVCVILYVARTCAGKQRNMRYFLLGPMPGVVTLSIVAMLIAKEPDLGTALLVACTGYAVLFFAGMKGRHLAAALAITFLVGGVYCAITAHSGGGSGYQMDRIKVLLNPEKFKLGPGFQVYRSTLALGTGGLTGDGLGLGREKLSLPEAYTDFIFAVVGEEGGLVATLSILALYGLIFARGMHIACNTRDRFGALLASGISFSIALQALVNISTATATLPATGVPLPGISYGGTSLMLTLFMAGVLLNIGRFPDGNPSLNKENKTMKAEREYHRRFKSPSTDNDDYISGSAVRPRRTVSRTA